MVCLSPDALSKVCLGSCLSLHTQIASTEQSARHTAGACIGLEQEQADRLTAPPTHAKQAITHHQHFYSPHPIPRVASEAFPAPISLPNGPEDAAIHLQGPGFGRLCQQHHDTALPPERERQMKVGMVTFYLAI